MSQPTPRKYPAAFKERAVKLAVESEQAIAQSARELGVNENTLHTWIGQYHRTERQEKEVHDEPLYEELKRLRKENARVKEEHEILKKGGGVLCATAAVKYAWLHQQPTAFTVSRMCQLLAVSRRGYYEWLARPPSPHADVARQLQEKGQGYCAQGRGTYGTHRMKHLLAQESLQV